MADIVVAILELFGYVLQGLLGLLERLRDGDEADARASDADDDRGQDGRTVEHVRNGRSDDRVDAGRVDTDDAASERDRSGP